MGVYLNPGNSGFQEILNSEYVDKTGMIRLINETIDTKRKLVCVSRPRRFGKSFAAQMLCAYYGKGCDSRELFSGLAIENEPSFADYLNKYDVIYLDMTGIIGEAGGGRFIDFIKEKVTEELKEAYPALKVDSAFTKTLANAVELNHNKFIVIIDEWDAPIRELPGMESAYLDFLRTLFKNSGTTAKLFSAAYMTGILPIKKNGSQSAISDFQEYTMIRPGPFGEYVGFTEAEVKELCDKHGADFSMMKQWYDGYYLKNTGSVYNPNSVMSAIREEDYYSYWTESAAASGLMEYISKDYNGLTKTIAELIGGLEVKVDTLGFGNDPSSFRGKDDVLTLLVHYGYLAYDASKKTVRIPNEEIRLEFQRSVREVPHEATRRRVAESDKLFHDTIAGEKKHTCKIRHL